MGNIIDVESRSPLPRYEPLHAFVRERAVKDAGLLLFGILLRRLLPLEERQLEKCSEEVLEKPPLILLRGRGEGEEAADLVESVEDSIEGYITDPEGSVAAAVLAIWRYHIRYIAEWRAIPGKINIGMAVEVREAYRLPAARLYYVGMADVMGLGEDRWLSNSGGWLLVPESGEWLLGLENSAPGFSLLDPSEAAEMTSSFLRFPLLGVWDKRRLWDRIDSPFSEDWEFLVEKDYFSAATELYSRDTVWVIAAPEAAEKRALNAARLLRLAR